MEFGKGSDDNDDDELLLRSTASSFMQYYCTQVIMSAVTACPWPLYVSMLMKDAITWRSSLDVSQLVLPDSVQAAFNQLLDNLEKQLGPVFVSHTLAFITVVRNGICEVCKRGQSNLAKAALNASNVVFLAAIYLMHYALRPQE